MTPQLLYLPHELILIILRYTAFEDLKTCRGVCHFLAKAAVPILFRCFYVSNTPASLLYFLQFSALRQIEKIVYDPLTLRLPAFLHDIPQKQARMALPVGRMCGNRSPEVDQEKSDAKHVELISTLLGQLEATNAKIEELRKEDKDKAVRDEDKAIQGKDKIMQDNDKNENPQATEKNTQGKNKLVHGYLARWQRSDVFVKLLSEIFDFALEHSPRMYELIIAPNYIEPGRVLGHDLSDILPKPKEGDFVCQSKDKPNQARLVDYVLRAASQHIHNMKRLMVYGIDTMYDRGKFSLPSANSLESLHLATHKTGPHWRGPHQLSLTSGFRDALHEVKTLTRVVLRLPQPCLLHRLLDGVPWRVLAVCELIQGDVDQKVLFNLFEANAMTLQVVSMGRITITNGTWLSFFRSVRSMENVLEVLRLNGSLYSNHDPGRVVSLEFSQAKSEQIQDFVLHRGQEPDRCSELECVDFERMPEAGDWESLFYRESL